MELNEFVLEQQNITQMCSIFSATVFLTLQKKFLKNNPSQKLFIYKTLVYSADITAIWQQL